MPLNKETIKRLLLYLEETLKEITQAELTKNKLLRDKDLRLSMERRLQTTIEACIDIAFHIIASKSLRVVEHNKDAILLLGEKGIIEKNLANRIAGATDMRNVLVHGYSHIDLDLFFKALTEDLEDLKEFAHQINSFLEKNPSV